MDVFWIVTLFHYQPSMSQKHSLDSLATSRFGTIGIEEFSLSEPEVDEILGERSYSGGDLTQEVVDEVEKKVLNSPTTCRFFFNNKANAENFLSVVKSEYLCEAQIEEKKTQDWNTEWKKHYSPIKINDLLEIIPSWQNSYTSLSREKIYIYPGMGFGTGSHETTNLCLKLFTENLIKSNFESVLDFGSGSGILGLTIFKFFPEAKVDFYDIDPEANKNCYQNAEVNNLHDKSFRLLLPEFRDKLHNGYDLIFANILEGILIQEKDYLVSLLHQEGYLILSGLLNHQAKYVIDTYSSKKIKLINQLQLGDWTALLFKKV